MDFLDIVSKILRVLGIFCRILIISLLFYEYPKFSGYINNILVAYPFVLIVYILFAGLALLILNQTDWNRQSDKLFKIQLKFSETVYNNKLWKRVVVCTNYFITLVAAIVCILLAKWFLCISLFVAFFINLFLYACAQKFKEKYKNKIKELQDRGIIKKIVPEVKKQEENRIVTRLKNIG